MSLPRFPARPAAKRPSRILTEPPGPWPVDRAVSRRVAEARRRLEHTRKALARRAPVEGRPPSEPSKGRRIKARPASPGGARS